jgi:4a-hydroxytetrahydrobiopterin dehydratase
MAASSKEQIHQKPNKMEGWSHGENAIDKKYTFRSFMPAIQFINKIAEAAESPGHHPDITINYNVVTISLSTHSEGGVSDSRPLSSQPILPK